MSSSHKHYDYFKVEGTDVKALIDGFDDIGGNPSKKNGRRND